MHILLIAAVFAIIWGTLTHRKPADPMAGRLVSRPAGFHPLPMQRAAIDAIRQHNREALAAVDNARFAYDQKRARERTDRLMADIDRTYSKHMAQKLGSGD